MQKVTYAMPARCKHCGNDDRAKMLGDWTAFDCDVCGKRTPYVVAKVEEIPDAAP